MSKQTLAIVGVLAVTFGAGIGLGLYLASDPSRSDVTPKTSSTGWTSSFFSDAAAQDREQNNTLLSSRIRELETELAAQKQDQAAIMADRLALFKKYHQEVRLRSFNDGSCEVTQAMADVLNLTKEEKLAVQQHLKEIQKEMGQLRDADTVLAKQTATSVSYEIPVDAKGKDLKDKLTQYLTADLGEDRSALFLEDADFDNYGSSFAGFSQQKGAIDIGWTTQNGKPMYTYKETYGGGSMWSDTPQPNLPGNLEKYLPTDSGQ